MLAATGGVCCDSKRRRRTRPGSVEVGPSLVVRIKDVFCIGNYAIQERDSFSGVDGKLVAGLNSILRN